MSMDIEKKGGAIPCLLDEIVINYGGGCCLYNSDCLDVLRTLPDGSVDMILQDPPYNMTACAWDKALDFAPLWAEWKRIIKPDGAIVMTAGQPFSSRLVMTGIDLFRYEWIWEKTQATGHLNAYKMPMKKHEQVLVFYGKQPTYNVQLADKPIENIRPLTPRTKQSDCYGTHGLDKEGTRKIPNEKTLACSVLNFANDQNGEHPTQKPVDLFRYLIRTYTNEGETVFDGYGGSGTTAIACIQENRKYIVCEKEAEYIEISKKRIDEATRQGNLFSAVGCCPHDL